MKQKSKESWTATLIDKIGFETKYIIQDTKESFIMIKASIPQKDIKIINTYGPNNRALKNMSEIK